MKRLPQCLLALLLLINFPAWGVDIFVAVNGSDLNDGSKEKPLATISAALRKAREMRRLNEDAIVNGIHIIVKGGVYNLYEPLLIRPEDAGTTLNPTYIEAAPGETPVLSGGFQIPNWKKTIEKIAGLPATAQGKVWVADVPLNAGRSAEFRQLWVNDKKAVRAKSMNGDLMDRILSWNKKEQTCWIPTPKTLPVQNVNGVEMFIHQWWAIAVLRIKKMETSGDSTKLFFHQPESKIQSEHPWPAPWISKETGNSAFYLANAIQFLDEPGEWYLDIAAHKIYYWPRLNENMPAAHVVAPSLETLVKIEGTADNPVSNIYIKGISFHHTGWLRPSQQGHVPHQEGMYMTEAYRLKPAGTKDKPTLDNQAWIGRPAAAVEINFADKTGFENCRFEHLASTGIDYNKAAHDNFIRGNLFKDIGGTAILAGVYSDAATEIHLPYDPKDEREVCDKMIISNNLVTDATNEDWSCVGIGLGYTKNSLVEHNEVENVSYSGISMGWGWSLAANAMKNNSITKNKIHHYGKHNYDCSGIYTLSAQPNSFITGNYIDSIYKAPYAHLPSHWFYIYTDEGSSYFTVKNNWTPSKKYLQNANGPGNEWSNNGPLESEIIKQTAGLQAAYQWLIKEKTAYKRSLPINEEHPEVIELVVKAGKKLDMPRLKQLLSRNGIDSNAVYQWQDHYVIFDKIQDVGVMQERLQNNFPEAEVKVYHDLFYEYSKKKHCPDKTTPKEWEHIILTANLVADKKLQQEYLDYHTTQFEKWPDIARGFCNANFQQLLLFRNGRQLILIISIPKGESLDKLNPKTTENNPMMIEWNKRMGKYQEGIEGAKKGETWVFLKK
ncbi:MAG TPA: right-handed parallel beta-helix repeat-containing protein [Ferruginibacter sp.]|nr:right-handed parallel beta-helix repeat-containing protein [Ferruginibacter sp.]